MFEKKKKSSSNCWMPRSIHGKELRQMRKRRYCYEEKQVKLRQDKRTNKFTDRTKYNILLEVDEMSDACKSYFL